MTAQRRRRWHSAAHIRLQLEISTSATPDPKISSSEVDSIQICQTAPAYWPVVGWLAYQTRRVASLCAGAALLAGLVSFARLAGAQLLRPPCGASTNTTGVPFLTLLPNNTTSQFVSRTQPWDSVLLTLEGSEVPWMPYPSDESPIQYDPAGLFGPGLMVKASLDFTPLNL